MNSLTQIIGASARFDILRALHFLHDPVGLRQLARLAGVHPHSAERMLRDLVKERVVTRKKKGSRVLFSRNQEHPDWYVLGAVIRASDKALRDLQRPRLNERAQATVSFVEEAGGMMTQARRTVCVD